MLIFADPCGKFYATTAQALQGLYTNLTAVAIKTTGLPAGNVEDTCFDLSGANCEGRILVPTSAGPYIYAVRLYIASSIPSNFQFLNVMDHTGTSQVMYVLNANGTISSFRGNFQTALLGNGTTAATLLPNTWNRIEFKTSISTTTGISAIRVNGITVLNLTNQNTQNSGNTDIGFFRFIGSANSGGPTLTGYAQSMYICDTTGSFNNDYMGDLSWKVSNASRPGSFAQFANNGAATNWQCMADVTPDDLTTYASDPTPGDRTSVGYASAASGTIPAVVHISRVAKSDAGSRTFAQTIRSGTTDIIGPTTAPTTSFAYYTQIAETDPATGLPWTTGALNAVEGGVKIIA